MTEVLLLCTGLLGGFIAGAIWMWRIWDRTLREFEARPDTYSLTDDVYEALRRTLRR